MWPIFTHNWLLGQNLSRRAFIRSMGAAGVAALLARGERWSAFASDAPAPKRFAPTAENVIFLWIAGGMAQTETFDPKPMATYQKGLDPRRCLSTFPEIPTNVDNIKFSQGLESMAGIMDKATLIRSMVVPDLGVTDHTRHQFHWHTGYVPPQTISVPHFGSFICRTLGVKRADVPAFVHIGQHFEQRAGELVRSYLTGGFLGNEYDPFLVTDPRQAGKSLLPPEGMTPTRLENRYAFYKKLVDASPVAAGASDYQRESLIRSLENAHRLVASKASVEAFDLTREAPDSYARYDKGDFGLGCLLAKRLIEAGSRFVEVSTEFIPFENWDTHVEGHKRTAQLKKGIDQPIAQLIRDLEQSGLLSKTLVIVASEFGRVNGINVDHSPKYRLMPIASPKEFGMHQHFIHAASLLFFGAGVKKGVVYGVTSNEHPCNTIENPVSVQDLHATIFATLGIPVDYYYEAEKRPFYATQNATGTPIREVLSGIAPELMLGH